MKGGSTTATFNDDHSGVVNDEKVYEDIDRDGDVDDDVDVNLPLLCGAVQGGLDQTGVASLVVHGHVGDHQQLLVVHDKHIE